MKTGNCAKCGKQNTAQITKQCYRCGEMFCCQEGADCPLCGCKGGLYNV